LAGEAFDDGEPQTRALCAGARSVAAIERALGGLQFGLIQAYTMIVDGDDDHPGLAREFNFNGWCAVAMGVFQQIGERTA
jgi:hypothetical protein